MWTLFVSLALAAGFTEDLTLAADADVPEVTRMQAFERLVSRGTGELGPLREVATDEAADARHRWVAIRVIGQVRGGQARDILVELTHHDMPAMRAAAAQALGDVRDPNATGAVAVLLEDPAIMVRTAAAESLAELGDPTAVEALCDALEDRSNFYRGSSLWVRRYYVEALGQIGSRRALPTFLRTLDDADLNVVDATVAALEQMTGMSYEEGRSPAEEREAWRRWIQSQSG